MTGREYRGMTADQRLAVTAKFFHGLSDLTRLRIVEVLLEGEQPNVHQGQHSRCCGLDTSTGDHH